MQLSWVGDHLNLFSFRSKKLHSMNTRVLFFLPTYPCTTSPGASQLGHPFFFFFFFNPPLPPSLSLSVKQPVDG
jgi:hypothetical protein